LGAIATAFAVLAAHHFATSSWPLSNGNAGVLVAAGLLLILAQGLKALGWARLFAPRERPRPLALLAGNGGAALASALSFRAASTTRCGSPWFAAFRRPAGIRVLCLSWSCSA
jgi:hypothetical protein